MAKQLSLQVCIIIMMILFLMFAGLSLVDMECLAMARGGLFCVFLLAMAVIDFRTGLLPDKGNLYLAALGLVMATIVGSLRDALLGALLGAALLFALRTLSRGGIGLGDVKYAAALGIWLGWQGTLLALMLAFALGACLARLARHWAAGPSGQAGFWPVPVGGGIPELHRQCGILVCL